MNAEQTTLIRFAGSRDGAHLAVKEIYDQAKTLVALQKRVKLTCEEAEDEISIRQRGFLHKAVFPQIAEQVVLPADMGGGRLDWRVWKEIFRARFLGDRYVLKAVARWDAKLGRVVIPKRKTPHRVRVSTEDLGVKRYSKYIDTVIDNAVVDYRVHFVFIAEEREAVRWVAQPRKKQVTHQPEEATA